MLVAFKEEEGEKEERRGKRKIIMVLGTTSCEEKSQASKGPRQQSLWVNPCGRWEPWGGRPDRGHVPLLGVGVGEVRMG